MRPDVFRGDIQAEDIVQREFITNPDMGTPVGGIHIKVRFLAIPVPEIAIAVFIGEFPDTDGTIDIEALDRAICPGMAGKETDTVIVGVTGTAQLGATDLVAGGSVALAGFKECPCHCDALSLLPGVRDTRHQIDAVHIHG